MTKIPIVIDCDPGVDDAFCIMLANSCGKFDIKAITPVAGNVELKYTSKNALDLADFLGIETRVAIGAKQPIIMELKTASTVHGHNGLANYILPEAKSDFDNKKAWDAIYEEAIRAKGQLNIVAVGPLTNVAIAILKYRDLKDYIKRITIMGGSTALGNHSQYGEFNIWVDPHAADIVFKSQIPITLVGLNATHQAALNEQEMWEIASTESRVSELVRAIYDYAFKGKTESQRRKGMILHDAITIAHLIDENILETTKYYVTCETRGTNTFGRTVVDFNGVCNKEPNVDVAVKANKALFKDMVLKMMNYYQYY